MVNATDNDCRAKLAAVRAILERPRDGADPWELLHEIDIATSHEHIDRSNANG